MDIPKNYFTKTRIGILAVSSMGMASLAITPSYAAIAKTFALNNTSVQMLTSLPNLFMMLAGLLMGKLTASKINLKSLVLTMIACCSVGGFLPLLFHDNFYFLLTCSCLVGLGQGACTNLSQALIAKMLPASERQSTMGLTTTFTNIGGIIFIMGGGQLAATSGWVNNYWIYLFTLLVLILVLLLVPFKPIELDEKANDHEDNGGIKLNKYVFYCAMWAFCTMLLNNALNNNIAIFISQNNLGSTSQAAFTSTISLIGGMLCGLVVGKIGQIFSKSSIALAFFLYGISYLIISIGSSLVFALIGSFISGAAMSIAMGQFAYLISIIVDKKSTSMALGVYQAINPIGGVISPFVLNPITQAVKGMGANVFTVSGILALILGVVVLATKFQSNLLANRID